MITDYLSVKSFNYLRQLLSLRPRHNALLISDDIFRQMTVHIESINHNQSNILIYNQCLQAYKCQQWLTNPIEIMPVFRLGCQRYDSFTEK